MSPKPVKRLFKQAGVSIVASTLLLGFSAFAWGVPLESVDPPPSVAATPEFAVAPTEDATQPDSSQPGVESSVPAADPSDEGTPATETPSQEPVVDPSVEPTDNPTDPASATPVPDEPTDPTSPLPGDESTDPAVTPDAELEAAGISPFAVIPGECGNGSECAGLKLTTIVNGGTQTAADFTLRAVRNNATSDEFFFTSGVGRTVPRNSGGSGTTRTTYTLSVTPTNAAGNLYARSLECTVGSPDGRNNETTFNVPGQYVQFNRGTGGTPATRYADCTFTLTYTPGIDIATVQVQVGGDRTGTTAVAAVSGIQLGLFESLSAVSPVDATWGVCTSDATGLCEFKIPDAYPGGANYDRELYVRAIGPSVGTFAVHTRLGVGSAGQNDTEYGFRVGATGNDPVTLRGGNTYTSTSDFMLGTGSSTGIASGGVFQTVRANPSFPPQCGLRVALILDVSGSVNGYEDSLASAATTMVNALTGTPSSVALFSFNNTAPASVLANQPNLQAVSTPAGAAIVKSWYSSNADGTEANFTPTGSTNWDRGVYQAAISGVAYDIAIVITDGNPTSYNSPTQGPGNYTRFREIENGIFSANALKALGTRVVAVGVGAGVGSASAALNLSSISGPTAGSDYFQAASYEAAGAALRAAALGSCEGSITMVKQLVPNTNTGEDITGAALAGGWTFNASSSSGQVTVPASGITADATGAVNFPLYFADSTATSDITITEDQQTGHTLVTQNGQNAVCRDVATNASVAVTNSGATGFTLTGVHSASNISCTVYNRPPLPLSSVQVNKTWIVNGVTYSHGSQPTGLSASLTLTGPGGAGATNQQWGVARPGYTRGGTTVINESTSISEFLPGCRVTDSRVTSANGAPTDATLPYTATLSQADNTYTVTNTVSCEQKLILRKAVVGGNAQASDWTLGAYTFPEDPASGALLFSGTSGISHAVEADATYQLAEFNGPAVYVQDDHRSPDYQLRPLSTGSWLCIQVDANGHQLGNFSDGINGGATIPLGATIDCTATNRTATLTILKNVINDHAGNQVASAWNLTATPAAGVPGLTATTVTGANGESAANTFLVRPGHSYTLTEAGPTGYVGTLERWTGTSWVEVDDTDPISVAVGQHDRYRWVNNDNADQLRVALTATPTFSRDYDWAIAKSVDAQSARVRPGDAATFEYDVLATASGPQDSGFALSGVITVTNPNIVDADVTVTAPTGPTGTVCTLIGSGSITVPAAIGDDPGVAEVSYTCTMPAGTTSASAGSLTANVTWDATELPGTTGTAQAVRAYNFAVASPTVTDRSVVVGDTAPEFAANFTVAERTLDAVTLLAGTGSKTFTYSRDLGDEVVGGRCLDFPNTATIPQTSDQAELSSSQSVQVCAGQNLAVSKVVVSSLTRTYDWDIEKTVDNTRLAVGADGIATFNYTVTAKPQPYSDSNWAMSGTITVDNPNKWDVTGVNVTDTPDIGGGVVCVVTNGTNATIPAATDAGAGSKQFAYVCTFTSAPYLTGINTAKAVWDADQAGSPAAEATGTAPIGSRWTITPINDEVTVIDDKTNPADPKVLGTAKWGPVNTIFTYSVTLNGPSSEDESRCVSYTNTAAIAGLTDQDQETVQVCAPEGDVAKDVVSTTQNADLSWTVVYDVTVTNLSTEDTLYYDLDDEFDFGDGVLIVADSAAVSGPSGVTTSPTWNGANDTTIVTRQSLAAGAVHAYRITVQVTLDSQHEAPMFDCTDGESGGFRNLTAIEYPGGSDDAEACSAPAAPVVEKNALAAVQDTETGDWTVSYEVIVSNPADVGIAYALTDEPAALPAGVELVGSWAISGPEIVGGGSATLTSGWNGIDQLEAATGLLPARGEGIAKHTFTVTGTVRIAATVPDEALDCESGEGGVNGIVNEATVANGYDSDDDSDCVPILRPMVSLSKTVASTRQLVDGTWQIVYDVVVTNLSTELVAIYNLSDELDFGGDIVVNSASWTGPSSGDFSAGSAVLATNKAIGPDGTHTYVVTVNATVSADAWAESATLECRNGEGGPETGGFLNLATVTSNGADYYADACAEPSLPIVTKAGAGAIQDPTDASKWLVSYIITVTSGAHDTFYSLADDPGFAPGIVVGSGTAHRTDIPGQPVVPVVPGAEFVSDVELLAETSHVYRLTWVADVTLDFDPTDLEVQCSEVPVEGQAFFNSVRLLVGDVVRDDSTCIPVEERVYPTVTKTETSTRNTSADNWTITYDVVVKLAQNEKGLGAEYNLADKLDFGAGITVVTAKWTGPLGASGVFTGNDAVMATNVTIASGAEHVYRVTVEAKVSSQAFADNTHLCKVTEGQPQTGGFLNTVLLSSGNQDGKAFDCSEPKPPTAPPPVTGADGFPYGGLAILLVVVTAGGLLVRRRLQFSE